MCLNFVRLLVTAAVLHLESRHNLEKNQLPVELKRVIKFLIYRPTTSFVHNLIRTFIRLKPFLVGQWIIA